MTGAEAGVKLSQRELQTSMNQQLGIYNLSDCSLHNGTKSNCEITLFMNLNFIHLDNIVW